MGLPGTVGHAGLWGARAWGALVAARSAVARGVTFWNRRCVAEGRARVPACQMQDGNHTQGSERDLRVSGLGVSVAVHGRIRPDVPG